MRELRDLASASQGGNGWIRLQHKQPAVSAHHVSTRPCEEEAILKIDESVDRDTKTRLNLILDKRRKMIFGIDIVYINARPRDDLCIDKTDSAHEYCSFVERGSNLYACLNGFPAVPLFPGFQLSWAMRHFVGGVQHVDAQSLATSKVPPF